MFQIFLQLLVKYQIMFNQMVKNLCEYKNKKIYDLLDLFSNYLLFGYL